MTDIASLSDAGNVAAIVAASASVVILAWSVGRWLRAADLVQGLHISQYVGRPLDWGTPGQTLRIEVGLTNGSGRPLSYRPCAFRIYSAHESQQLESEEPQYDVAPTQTALWYFRAPWRQLPATVTVDYEFRYGRRGRRPRRLLRGSFDVYLPALGPDKPEVSGFISAAPTREEPLPWRWRPSIKWPRSAADGERRKQRVN